MKSHIHTSFPQSRNSITAMHWNIWSTKVVTDRLYGRNIVFEDDFTFFHFFFFFLLPVYYFIGGFKACLEMKIQWKLRSSLCEFYQKYELVLGGLMMPFKMVSIQYRKDMHTPWSTAELKVILVSSYCLFCVLST